MIGGGISGLAAAHRVCELAPDAELQLFEAGDHLGGVLQTERHGPYLIEKSGDMFITRDPWALELCRRIGFDDQLNLEGLVFRLQQGDEAAAGAGPDSTSEVPGAGELPEVAGGVNLRNTRRNLEEIFKYRGLLTEDGKLDPDVYRNENEQKLK